MNSTARPAPMVTVLAGRRAIGFILNRGKPGFEAFDLDESSLGVFAISHDAAAAISDSIIMRAAP